MRIPVPCAALLLLLLPAPAPAADPGAIAWAAIQSVRSRPVTVPTDSVVVYASAGKLVAIAFAGDSVYVTAPNRFDAAGQFDGSTGLGMTGALGSAGADARRSVLRLTRLEGGSLRAEFSDDMASRPKRTETWTLQYRQPIDGAGGTSGWPDSTLAPEDQGFAFAEALPEVLERVAPTYPDRARSDGTHGTVVLMVLVGRDGTVRGTKIVHSIPVFDGAAQAAAMQWRFKPATSGGKPVAVWVEVSFSFSPPW
jgi:TonB family protein